MNVIRLKNCSGQRLRQFHSNECITFRLQLASIKLSRYTRSRLFNWVSAVAAAACNAAENILSTDLKIIAVN